MKKNFSKLGIVAVALFGAVATSVSSCGRNPNEIIIQFVPSRDASSLSELASALEPLLEEKCGYEVTINTGDSYAAVTEALASDQIDFGFLTASGYAQAKSEEDTKDKVEILLTSIRDGYQVQLDVGEGKQSEQIRREQVDAMNGGTVNGTAYEYLGQQTQGKENSVTFYNSVCFVLSDEKRAELNKKPLDLNKDGTITIDELAGQKVFTQGQTSGAGYLYPSKFLFDLQKEENQNIWFSDNWEEIITDKSTFSTKGMTMVDGTADASKGQIQRINTDGGYDAALNAVLDGTVDAAWGFMDIRYANGYNKVGHEYYQNPEMFTDTRTVCMTAPIYNDTISYRTSLEEEKVTAIKEAFMALAEDGDKDEIGTGAYYLYHIYSHTGYQIPVIADYDSEIEMYKWKVANGF